MQENEAEKPTDINDLPNEILTHVSSFFKEKQTILNFSRCSHRMFDITQEQRLQLAFSILLKKSGLDWDGFDRNYDETNVNLDILINAIPKYGSLLVLGVFEVLNDIAQTPTELAPKYIEAIRKELPKWKELVLTHTGVLGFVTLFNSEFARLKDRLHDSCVAKSSLQMLRYLYSIQYLMENKLDNQTALKNSMIGSSHCAVAIPGFKMIVKKQGDIHFIKENFEKLEKEILFGLGFKSKEISQYGKMGDVQYYMKQDAFEELRELNLVEQDEDNPYTHGYRPFSTLHC